MKKYNKIINNLKKKYKNNKLLLEIFLENYHDFNIYIRLDYYKKDKLYALSWINLDRSNLEKNISYEYLEPIDIEKIENFINNLNSYEYIENDKNIVTINNYFNDSQVCYKFNRYVPKELGNLFNVLVVVFDNLPLKLNGILQELAAKIVGNTNRFEYKEPIKFDLFLDPLNILFTNDTMDRGNEYFNQGRVFFLEKISDTYYSVVGGKELYVITIKYKENEKEMQVYCSCPCEHLCAHIYAVILAIRNKVEIPFYKITHKEENINLLEKIMNFNFFLCIGIDDDKTNYLVIQDGIIKILPIINELGDSEWQILEDDKQETLTKKLNEILK